jgi:L-threonylcarbamoyladenylate synthase
MMRPSTRHLARAAQVIKDGGVVAYATEYCFGFGCDPRNRDAVLRLLRIKQRAVRKGVILLAGHVDQLARFVDALPETVLASWPGPHTWLVAPASATPHWITGAHPRVAVRVTAHAQAAALCLAAGTPLVSTSANRAGETPGRDYRDVVRRFGGELDFVVPGQVGDLAAPTPIRDSASGATIRA